MAAKEPVLGRPQDINRLLQRTFPPLEGCYAKYTTAPGTSQYKLNAKLLPLGGFLIYSLEFRIQCDNIGY